MSKISLNARKMECLIFVNENLQECVSGLLELHDTGMLLSGKFLRLRQLCAKWVGHEDAARVAEGLVKIKGLRMLQDILLSSQHHSGE